MGAGSSQRLEGFGSGPRDGPDQVAQVSEKIREHMSAAAKLDVPLLVEVGVGNNWDEAH